MEYWSCLPRWVVQNPTASIALSSFYKAWMNAADKGELNKARSQLQAATARNPPKPLMHSTTTTPPSGQNKGVRRKLDFSSPKARSKETKRKAPSKPAQQGVKIKEPSPNTRKKAPIVKGKGKQVAKAPIPKLKNNVWVKKKSVGESSKVSENAAMETTPPSSVTIEDIVKP